MVHPGEAQGHTISGVLVEEKIRLLHQQLYPGESEDDFRISTGWLHRFRTRHGVR